MSAPMQVTTTTIARVLTRTSGFLHDVTSHSLQPYRGCSFGASLCGTGCYVRHNPWLLRGRAWGSFLEVRSNAAESYLACADAERRWARRARGRFGVFLSSSTDPFVPHEDRYGVTRAVLAAMLQSPPDLLIVQSHTDRIANAAELYLALARCCELRLHLSIESDRDRLPGLPPPASPVQARLAAARRMRELGLRVVVTVAPLLPIAEPDAFFAAIAASADAVVLDHFIGGDGTHDGSRTRRTALPEAIARVDPRALELSYLDRMVEVARRHLPGRVGVDVDGFAGRYLR